MSYDRRCTAFEANQMRPLTTFDTSRKFVTYVKCSEGEFSLVTLIFNSGTRPVANQPEVAAIKTKQFWWIIDSF